MISTPFLAVPPREYGGIELIVHELVEGLVARGHDVTLFATGDSATAGDLCSLYPQAQWPPDTLTDLNHVAWAMQHARQGGYDLVHAHSAAALAVARLAPDTPLVYTLHHARDERYSTFYRHYRNAWYVAISRDQADREAKLSRVEVIHHGLDPSSFRWTDRPGDYVAFVGRLAREKGPHTAIDVAERAGVGIRIAGEVHPVDREFGEREVLPRLTRPHVGYLGNVGMEVKVPLLRDARALLAPVDWDEPFGLILIEAMLSGCPVVAFPRGSVPELVEEGVTGYLVRNAEGMAEAVRPGGPVDRIDRERCRTRAVERFSRDRMVEDYLRLYGRVVEAGR